MTIAGNTYGQTRTETVRLNGIDLYYEVYGAGEPLLLLHGWTQSSAFWKSFVPAYSGHYEVYAIDLRGHGRTTPLAGDFTIQRSARDIQALLDYLKLEKVHAIGLSFGGLALLELAHSSPERLLSMILIGTSSDYNGAEKNEDGNSFSYEDLPAPFLQDLRETHFFGEEQIRAMFNPDLHYQISLTGKELESITCPVLIIQGDRDEILGVEPALNLYKNLPEAALWIVPDTGHLAVTDRNKEQFVQLSLEFMRKAVFRDN